MKYPRVLILFAVALVCLFTSTVATANQCAANVFSFTFANVTAPGGINGTFVENGSFDCADIQITDRVISTEFTLEAWEWGGTQLSDRMVFSNTNGFLNICILSYLDSGNQTDTCDPVGAITATIYAGDPTFEALISPQIFDVPTGLYWAAHWYSQDIGNQSDSFHAGVVPEPSSMLLVGTGVLGLAGVIRRKFKL